jgi:hypothetical protein
MLCHCFVYCHLAGVCQGEVAVVYLVPSLQRERMGVLQPTASGVLVRVRVQPRARVERLEGLHGQQLRLRVTAAPIDGAANAACIALLANMLGVRRSQVRLQAGEKSRDKVFHIAGVTATEVAAVLGIPLA